MRAWGWGIGSLALAGLFVASDALAQGPAPVTLIAAGNAEVASVRFAKLTSQELGRRNQPLVSEADGSALLGRPLAAAVADCSGDELCYVALGQVVNASQVLVVTAAFAKDPRNYDCFFHVIDVKSGKTRGPMVFSVIASEGGLSVAAHTVAESVAPKPRITTTATPTPVVAAPTPSPVTTASPVPSGTPASIVASASPTPTPGVTGLDETVPRPPRAKRPLTRDPAFWSVAGAGAIALGVGLFFGARSLQDDGGDEKEGTSTVEVRF